MGGNIRGGKLAAKTNKSKYGSDFYNTIGRLGGSVKNPNKGFGSNRKLASEAGRKGGAISKRGRASDYL